MGDIQVKPAKKDTVLLVENEVLERTAIGEYLRLCGYRVIEASSGDEVMAVLADDAIKLQVVFNAIPSFQLSHWVRHHRPELHLIVAGNMEKAAQAAGELCEEGPHLKKPYEPQQVIDWIKRMNAGTPPGTTACHNHPLSA